jgi:hypothetical protein
MEGSCENTELAVVNRRKGVVLKLRGWERVNKSSPEKKKKLVTKCYRGPRKEDNIRMNLREIRVVKCVIYLSGLG